MLRYTTYAVDDESRKDKFRGPGPFGYRCRETRHIVHRESFVQYSLKNSGSLSPSLVRKQNM